MPARRLAAAAVFAALVLAPAASLAQSNEPQPSQRGGGGYEPWRDAEAADAMQAVAELFGEAQEPAPEARAPTRAMARTQLPKPESSAPERGPGDPSLFFE